MPRRLAPLALAAFLLACGDDPEAPSLPAGTYALARSATGAALPIVVAASAEQEVVLASGQLTIPAAEPGTTPDPARLVLGLASGPIGGPYTADEPITVSADVLLRGGRIVLDYGEVADTLAIRNATTLAGAVTVPGAATGRVGVEFARLVLE